MSEIMDEDEYIVLITEEELKEFYDKAIKLSDLKHRGGKFYYNDILYTGKVYSELEYSRLLIGNIKDGRLDGHWRKIQDFGNNKINVYKEWHFKNNKRNGLYVEYEYDNIIEKIGYYINGKKEGVWKWYDCYSVLNLEECYSEGRKIWDIDYDDNSKVYFNLNSSCKSKNFYNFYKVQYFYKDGYLKEEYILTEKGRLGRIYYKNGQFMAEGNMIENPSWYIKVGRWNYYSEEGELQDIKIDYTYKEYLKKNGWTNYYQCVNGIEKGQGIIEETILKEETKEVPKIIKKEKIEWIDCIRYVDGVPNPDTSGIKEKEMGKTGTFIEYHSNGKIAKEETYYNGQLDGIAKYWHDDGELYLVRRYSSGIILEEAWEHNKNKISTILKNIWDLAVEWAEKENMKRLNGKK